MLLTFMRTGIGLDETVFLEALRANDVPFQNIDDTTFCNFRAVSPSTRLARRLLRGPLSRDMERTARTLIDGGAVTRAFVFNGRGFTRGLGQALHDLERVVWFNPDFVRHPEHRHLEAVASLVISTKPPGFNALRYEGRVPADRIRNVNPVVFATEGDVDSFLRDLAPVPLDQRPVGVAFLGNRSPAKGATVEALAALLRTRIVVVGAGWRTNRYVEALGPVYGPRLRGIFRQAKVGLAISDTTNGAVDPITARYFQYPLLGTLPILQRSRLNRAHLTGDLDPFCFENLVEARDRVKMILGMSPEVYAKAFRRVATALARATPPAESVLKEWVLE